MLSETSLSVSMGWYLWRLSVNFVNLTVDSLIYLLCFGGYLVLSLTEFRNFFKCKQVVRFCYVQSVFQRTWGLFFFQFRDSSGGGGSRRSAEITEYLKYLQNFLRLILFFTFHGWRWQFTLFDGRRFNFMPFDGGRFIIYPIEIDPHPCIQP